MSMFEFKTNTSPGQCICDTSQFPLTKPTADLFNGIAETLAKEISQAQMLVEKWDDRERRKVIRVENEKDANKPTQLRKFYDELCMWAEKTQTVEALEKNLPFIKMMNAKAAYARGRELVDDKFIAWFSSCLSQIKSADETGLIVFKNFRTLFEAFMGFYKVARPK